ncbi:AI-2E family transporter [Tianweitania sp. BSSL-BM11]|uniref:AI-2E family transporter n=2 Tax=Tianweitania aestuarii TaxID=2814886 RepID=A0ABS5RST0_9HYPH|nr:AI-2E family transporter [Tianweitania aestuarii]MBS9720022.1 AI-2E family transporter [Tianweitania aestuarii]
MNARFARTALFWGAALLGFIAFLVVFSSILLPFVAGMALAYFLDPVADRLERLGLSRLMATIMILIGFLLAVVLVVIIIVPLLSSQLSDFISNVPGYITNLQALITDFDPEWLRENFGVEPAALREALSGLVTQGVGFITTLLQSLWNSGKAIVDVVALFVVTPVVAFYMLLDWDRMIATIDRCVPRDHIHTVRQLARDVNRATAGFVRGQGTLCLILGAMYAVGLTMVGLNFGLLIGLFAGLISFIPYVGSLVGLVLSIGVAFVQFWPDWPMVVLVAAIFFGGQFIEGNILQPKLVGSSVGLHPVWLMFALFAFGSLFGFVGLLLAVPAAAAVGVLVRFMIARYLASPLYKGKAGQVIV